MNAEQKNVIDIRKPLAGEFVRICSDFEKSVGVYDFLIVCNKNNQMFFWPIKREITEVKTKWLKTEQIACNKSAKNWVSITPDHIHNQYRIKLAKNQDTECPIIEIEEAEYIFRESAEKYFTTSLFDKDYLLDYQNEEN